MSTHNSQSAHLLAVIKRVQTRRPGAHKTVLRTMIVAHLSTLVLVRVPLIPMMTDTIGKGVHTLDSSLGIAVGGTQVVTALWLTRIRVRVSLVSMIATAIRKRLCATRSR